MTTLDAPSLQALLDVLTHHQTFSEVCSLKSPETFEHLRAPLGSAPQSDISTPLLQLLFRRFVLRLPGIESVDVSFWSENLAALLGALAGADLSESYDKGSIGIRKTFSTAISSLLESVTRGILGGVRYTPSSERRTWEQRSGSPSQYKDGWKAFLHEALYANGIDKVFAMMAKTGDLTDHDQAEQDAHEHCVIMVASFLHYLLIMSPKGTIFMALLSRVNDLLPYFIIRQTLRLGNAATMLNRMMKIVLAKMSLSSWTGWLGGGGSESGMNLLQYIISAVMKYDIDQLEKRVKKITQKQTQDQGLFEVVDNYTSMSASQQLEIRERSQQSGMSVIAAILDHHGIPHTQLSTSFHDDLLEYLALKLAARDRKELISVFCNHRPDLLTSTVRDIVTAYDPIIREAHNGADLGKGLQDLQAFLNELIQISKGGKLDTDPSIQPTVEEFCELARKHVPNLHSFIHQNIKNGPKIAEMYKEWFRQTALQYRRKETNMQRTVGGAGDFSETLQRHFCELSNSEQLIISNEMKAYGKYIRSLERDSSGNQMRLIYNMTESRKESYVGSGVYILKWQGLLDKTLITPCSAVGSVRTGRSESVLAANKIDVDGTSKLQGKVTHCNAAAISSSTIPLCPTTIRLLAPKFQAALAQL